MKRMITRHFEQGDVNPPTDDEAWYPILMTAGSTTNGSYGTHFVSILWELP